MLGTIFTVCLLIGIGCLVVVTGQVANALYRLGSVIKKLTTIIERKQHIQLSIPGNLDSLINLGARLLTRIEIEARETKKVTSTASGSSIQKISKTNKHISKKK